METKQIFLGACANCKGWFSNLLPVNDGEEGICYGCQVQLEMRAMAQTND